MDFRCKSLATWGLTEGYLFGGWGMGRAYLEVPSSAKVRISNSGSPRLPQFPVCKWQSLYLPCRAVVGRSMMGSEERKSRAWARQPEPGYLWVSVGRGATGRGRCLT